MSLTLNGQASPGSPLVLPVPDTLVGLTLPSYAITATQDAQLVATPTSALGLVLVEVDSTNVPGVYALTVVPTVEGTLTVVLTRGAEVFTYVLSVSSPRISDPSLEGEYTITVSDGGGPVEGAVVRVFDAAGTAYVTRGTTDVSGSVVFTLPVGTYQVRAYKSGVDFAAQNPTTIVVVGSATAAPILLESLPTSASIGDVIALTGSLFDATSQVWFGVTAVPASSVSPDGRLLLVTIPAGLTDTIIPLRVDKPDPANLPLGKLNSNTITMVRV